MTSITSSTLSNCKSSLCWVFFYVICKIYVNSISNHIKHMSAILPAFSTHCVALKTLRSATAILRGAPALVIAPGIPTWCGYNLPRPTRSTLFYHVSIFLFPCFTENQQLLTSQRKKKQIYVLPDECLNWKQNSCWQYVIWGWRMSYWDELPGFIWHVQKP